MTETKRRTNKIKKQKTGMETPNSTGQKQAAKTTKLKKTLPFIFKK